MATFQTLLGLSAQQTPATYLAPWVLFVILVSALVLHLGWAAFGLIM